MHTAHINPVKRAALASAGHFHACARPTPLPEQQKWHGMMTSLAPSETLPLGMRAAVPVACSGMQV